MKSRSLLVIPVLTLFCQSAHAQDSVSANSPITLKPIIGKPYFKILKVEDEPNRHYEKWIEVNYVIGANVPPSPESKTYVLPSWKGASFNLNLQTNQKKADFARRWTELRQELEGIHPNTENWQVEGLNAIQANLPILKKWDLAQWMEKGLSTTPAFTTKNSGLAAYYWVTRTIEMEGTRIGQKSKFKATIDQFVGGMNCNYLGFDNTFDTTICQILDRDGKPVKWQQSLIDGDFHKMG